MISVQVLVIEGLITGCRSLKEKRIVLNSLKDKIRSKYNVSVSELDFNDKWQKTLLGVACVSNNGKLNRKTLEKIADLIYEDGRIEIVNRTIEELA